MLSRTSIQRYSRIATTLLSALLVVLTAFGQERILVSTGFDELYELDLASCQTTLIGYSSTPFIDIAFTPNGRLWGAAGNSLYEINPQDGSDVLIGSMPGFGTVSLVAFNNDTLLGEYQAWLWGISVSDGSAWRIDSIGYYASGDLTWYDGSLYMTALGSKLIRMNVSHDLTSISDIQVVGFMNGSIGSWYGANTVLLDPCSGSKAMLGFDGQNVYFVSPVDATVQLSCLNIFPIGVTGATSMGELPIEPNPSFSMPNVFSPDGNGKNDLFAPMGYNENPNWSLIVFNRWGQKVHDGNGQTVPWDGRTPSGKTCPEGVYYYILDTKRGCSGTEEEHGYVTLLR